MGDCGSGRRPFQMRKEPCRSVPGCARWRSPWLHIPQRRDRSLEEVQTRDAHCTRNLPNKRSIKLGDGKPVDEKRLALLQDSELAEFSFTEAKKLSNGFHRKWHVRITNAEHQLPKKPITELVELLDM